jgi:hypothetical protein
MKRNHRTPVQKHLTQQKNGSFLVKKTSNSAANVILHDRDGNVIKSVEVFLMPSREHLFGTKVAS